MSSYRPDCEQISAARTSRRVAISLAVGFFAVLIPVVSAGALELWSDDPPTLPDNAESVLITRAVTHRDGTEIPARFEPYVRLEQMESSGVRQIVHDDRGGYLWTTIFEMEAQRISSIRSLAGDRLRWEMRFEYDAQSRPVHESYIGPGEQPERTIAYEYADDQTEIVAYRGDGTVAWRKSERAGLAFDQVETTFFYPDGSRVKTILATVDEQGRVVREEHLDELGSTYRTVELTYSQDTVTHEVVRDETGAVIRDVEWSFDPPDVLRRRTTDLPEEGVTEELTVDYELNDHGDWIKQVRTTTARFEERDPFVTDREVLQREVTYE